MNVPQHVCTPGCLNSPRCAKVGDHATALHAFETALAQEQTDFQVFMLHASVNHEKPYCSWTVYYTFQNPGQIYFDDGRAKPHFEAITRHTPSNYKVRNKRKIPSMDAYVVDYNTGCLQCRKPNFDCKKTHPNSGVMKHKFIEETKMEFEMQATDILLAFSQLCNLPK